MRKKPHERPMREVLPIVEDLCLQILERMNKMAQGQAELDAALATLNDSLTSLQNAIKGIGGTPAPIDLTSEVTAINNAAATLQQVVQQLTSAGQTPAPQPPAAA